MPRGRQPYAHNQIVDDDFRLTDADMPKFLTGRAAEVWAENLPRLHWLTTTDAPLFATWAQLMSEFEGDPAAMPTPRLAQMRLLANDLGLTGSGRERLGVAVEPPGADDDPAAEFLR